MVEDHIAYLIEVLGQDAKIIQPPGDVILLSTETKPVREIHWLGMCYLLMTSFLVVSDPSPLKGNQLADGLSHFNTSCI